MKQTTGSRLVSSNRDSIWVHNIQGPYDETRCLEKHTSEPTIYNSAVSICYVISYSQLILVHLLISVHLLICSGHEVKHAQLWIYGDTNSQIWVHTHIRGHICACVQPARMCMERHTRIYQFIYTHVRCRICACGE